MNVNNPQPISATIPQDPILLHSPDGKTTKSIPLIDAPAWESHGWSRFPPVPKAQVAPPPQDPPQDPPQGKSAK